LSRGLRLHRRNARGRRHSQSEPKTSYLKFGDVVRIETKDAACRSIFGAIEESLERYAP
jgi:hypothetical protein